MREVDIVFAWHERVEIVAADTSLNLGKALGNLISLSRTNREQIFRQWPQRHRYILETAADATEMRKRAVREQRLDRDHIVAHGPVAQRSTHAGIVAGQAADGR